MDVNASSFASRFASLCAALGFLIVAASAHAQFDECVQPELVPEFVFETIYDQASFDFGDVEDKVCSSIVKEGVKTCKAQVKAAAKCFDRALDTNYKIALKQCQALESSEARDACKAEYKATRDEGKGNVEESEDLGLAICDDDFAEELSGICTGLIPI
jgi:hypothetical protein